MMKLMTSLLPNVHSNVKNKYKFWGFFLFLVYLCIYVCIFLAALGLRCCAWVLSSCGKHGLLFIVVRGLLISVASLGEHEL